MKKKKLHLLAGVMFLLISFLAQAFTPEGISYQAVVRDSDNRLSANKNVGVKISILHNNQDAVYVETHSVTTNSNGLMSLQIGNGNAVSGLFSSIDWASGTYFVKTEIDPSGGTNYSVSSVAQLLSVPYALHSKTAQKLTEPVSYNDLVDTPLQENFSGDYHDLKNKPELKDSIDTYGFNGDYHDLKNKPELKDSIDTYGFNGNYNDLKNKPVFQDSIDIYGFSGSYNDLSNTPTLFDGNYESLANRPLGEQTGDILYWEEVASSGDENEGPTSGWRTLPRGAHGMILAMNEEGKPAWINITQLMSFVANAKYDTIYASAGLNGKITPKGEIAVIRGGLAQFTITPNKGYGIDSVYVDSVAISLDHINQSQAYSYTFEEVDTTHCIHAVFAQRKIKFAINYDGDSDSSNSIVLDKDNDVEISDGDEIGVPIGGKFSLKVSLTSGGGVQLSIDSVDITRDFILNGLEYVLSGINEDKTIVISFNKGEDVYSVGDIYPRTGTPEGIVCFAEAGGKSGIILHLNELQEAYPWDENGTGALGATSTTDGAANLAALKSVDSTLVSYPIFKTIVENFGEGWYLPSIEELQFVSTNFTLINRVLSDMGESATVVSEDNYWSSTEVDGERVWIIYMGSSRSREYKSSYLLSRPVKKFSNNP